MISPRLLGRLAIGFAIGLYTVASVLPWLMIVSYRREWTAVLDFLGQATVGDDWHSFLPLLQGTPDWLVGVMVAATALFLIGIVLLTVGQRIAAWVLAVAVVLTVIQFAALHNDPAYRRIFTTTGEVQDWLTVGVLAAMTAAAFWAVAPQRPTTAPDSHEVRQ